MLLQFDKRYVLSAGTGSNTDAVFDMAAELSLKEGKSQKKHFDDMCQMKYILLSFIETILFLLFSYVCYYSIEYFSFHDGTGSTFLTRFINRLKFLTIINAYILTLYFGVNVFIIHVSNKFVQSLRSNILSVLMTLSWFVTITFWALYFYDRELVYPKSLDDYVPQWWNVAAHLLNAISITGEALINKPQIKTTRLNFLLLLSIIIGYISLIEYNIRAKDHFVYPIFRVLPTFYRYLFNGGLMSASVLLLLVCSYFINRLVPCKTQKLNSKPAKSKQTISKSNQSSVGTAIRRKIRKD